MKRSAGRPSTWSRVPSVMGCPPDASRERRGARSSACDTGQPCVHLDERGGAQGVQPTSTVSADGDEPGGAEDPQVPGDTRLRDAQVTDELPHGPLTIAQEIEYLPARGVGERGERGHGRRKYNSSVMHQRRRGVAGDATLTDMPAPPDPKADLHRYLREARDAVLWKLEGLSGVRRAPSARADRHQSARSRQAPHHRRVGALRGRHSASHSTWALPSPPWVDDDAEPNATCGPLPTSRAPDFVQLYQRVAAHSDTVIDALQAGRRRPCALVAGGDQRGHPAPDPGAHDRRGVPARRPRRRRPAS